MMKILLMCLTLMCIACSHTPKETTKAYEPTQAETISVLAMDLFPEFYTSKDNLGNWSKYVHKHRFKKEAKQMEEKLRKIERIEYELQYLTIKPKQTY